MDLNRHCNLCDNAIRSIENGLICSVTNQKPDFEETCPKILLGENFSKKLGLIHIEIESLRKKKGSTYIYSFLYFFTGFILVISQRNLLSDFDFTFSKYKGSVEYLCLILLGLIFISLAYSKLSRYIKKIKVVKNEKERVDEVLNKYQIEYDCYVEFDRTYHGIQNVIVELKSNSNLLKDSKITFQV